MGKEDVVDDARSAAGMPRGGRRRRSESRENVGLKEEKESVHEGGLPFDRSHFVTESGERSW